MSSVHERNFWRVRGLVEYLSRQVGPVSKEAALAEVAQRWPPINEDLDPVSSGRPRWENDLLWQTTELTRAKWLTKDGKGTWSITDSGREALDRYSEPSRFKEEALSLYRTWYRQQRTSKRRAWLIRGSSVRGANIVAQWLTEGWVSLPASQLQEITPGIDADELTSIAQHDYDHLIHQELTSKVEEIVAFVTKIAVGDVVLTTNDRKVWVGDITGDWEWVSSEERRSNLRRPLTWRNLDVPVDFADLPDPLPAKLTVGAALADLTGQLDAIDGLTTNATFDVVEPSVVRHQHLPFPGATIASELFVERSWLVEVRDVLDERRQIVFYGPPGTGKTFIARKLAADLVGPEQVKLVQFHPAYTYEDFFEGYRPRPSAGDGTIGFELRPGPLRQLVSRAVEHPDQAFVLIIDEINRANLAKVFGELYFLLEYRDQAIDLLYSSENAAGFTLPPNLYLIGTMNTADRSIALVDAAMRRRFAFVALDPAREPTRSLLARWSSHHNLPSVAAELLVELNRRLDDPEFSIGPSYFMTRDEPDAFDRPRLERIWRTSIIPLLEEHFYGQWPAIASRYALDGLLRALPSGASREQEDAGADEAAQAEDESGFSPEAS